MEGLTRRLLEVDPSAEWSGVAHYNLACHYAQTQMAKKALATLRKSLELNPGLREWSRHDADLAPLHPLPEFESVVGSG